MDLPTPPRRYGDEEIARILKRATEIQIAEPSVSASSGMTLQELEDVAAEAGIDPQHLRRAAMELEVGEGDDPAFLPTFVGGSLVIDLDAVVPGELSAAGFERVLSVIQQTARHHGHGSLLGRTLTWQGENASAQRSLMVVVSAREGETSVRIEERLHGLAGALFGGIVGGGGMGMGISLGMAIGGGVLGSPLLAAVFPVGAIGLAFVSARALYRNRLQQRRRTLTELLDRIVRESSASMEANTRPGERSTPALPISTPGT